MLTQAQLKSQLSYNPETGIFNRTLKTGIVKVTGSKNSLGYIQIKINGRGYSAHRLAWLYITGEWPKEHIDHINGIKGDNRICNLRESTKSQNQWNAGSQKNNKSGFKGVSWHKRDQKWISSIRFHGKQKYLGSFADPEEAYLAYCDAAKEYHGEFANTGE